MIDGTIESWPLVRVEGRKVPPADIGNVGENRFLASFTSNLRRNDRITPFLSGKLGVVLAKNFKDAIEKLLI